LANTASAQKRIRSNAHKRRRNQVTRNRTRSAIRAAREALGGANVEASRKTTLEAISALDKAAEKGVIHKNNAARRKSRLMKKLSALETKK
jgi:small subunit ribosomal protein S20